MESISFALSSIRSTAERLLVPQGLWLFHVVTCRRALLPLISIWVGGFGWDVLRVFGGSAHVARPQQRCGLSPMRRSGVETVIATPRTWKLCLLRGLMV